MVMKFMRENGRPEYDAQIDAITEDYTIIQGEAGPGFADCPFVQERLDRIDAEVKEIVQRAVDRYDDWASDPLP